MTDEQLNHMTGELHAKARMLIEQALTPVVDEVARNYGRQGLIAFVAAMQQNLAMETRQALGMNVEMAILQKTVELVMAEEEGATEDAMSRAAMKLLTTPPVQ